MSLVIAAQSNNHHSHPISCFEVAIFKAHSSTYAPGSTTKEESAGSELLEAEFKCMTHSVTLSPFPSTSPVSSRWTPAKRLPDAECTSSCSLSSMMMSENDLVLIFGSEGDEVVLPCIGSQHQMIDVAQGDDWTADMS